MTIVPNENDQKTLIKYNKGKCGGGICAVSSAMFLVNLDFDTNRAYSLGGGIYFQNIILNPENGNEYPSDVTLIIQNSNFTKNNGVDIGGGIILQNAQEVTIENIVFKYNFAGFNGGAICDANCQDIRFVKCQFAYNIVDASIYS